MWLFALISQGLSVMSIGLLFWLVRPKRWSVRMALVIGVFVFNNAMLAYGLSEFWGERFRIYLMTGIVQGFLLYAVVITFFAVWVMRYLSRPIGFKGRTLLATGLWLGITGLAVYNTYTPVVRHLTVTTDKPLATSIKIALVSDTHLGKWFGNAQLKKLASLLEREQVDAILMAGDIMDDTTEYYDKTEMSKNLSLLNNKSIAPLGTYAILGNHDFMHDDRPIAHAISQAGITVLDNDTVRLGKQDNAIWLVGRSDDVDSSRPAAQTLLEQVDARRPIIFLEHRATQLAEISQLNPNVDLHVSGHTHGGQIFPLTLLAKWINPLNHGHKQVNGSHFVVSSGYGMGAVPFRLGTQSEIWVITLTSAAS